jgi:predicted transcriptional regulator of viral defense system
MRRRRATRDLLAVAYRAPRAIVCGVSAAAVHDLTDALPGAVQIAVPTRDRPPRISRPPTAVFRFDASTFELGLSKPHPRGLHRAIQALAIHP